MSVKTAGVGHFTIPTAPAAGTSCTSGAANVFTTTYVQLIASTAAALYITGLYVEEAAVTAGTYIIVQLATGAAASETIIGQYLVAPVTGSTVTRDYRPIFPPIPVANATRIACKTADSVGAQAKLITLECIAQSNVVDDGIAVGTVTTVTNQLTAAAIATGLWQDATAGDFTVALSIGKSVMNGVALGTGLTVNALTNAPTAGDFTAAMKTSLNASTPASVTGAVASVTAAVTLPGIPANWITAAGINAAAITSAKFGVSAIDAAALATDAVTEIKDGILAGVVEGTTTVAGSLRLANSALGGKSSGHASGNPLYRDIGDTKNRITATTDALGNRTTVTTDLT